MLTPELLHYVAIGLAVSLGSIGTGIGQGIAAFGSLNSLPRQNQGNDQIFRTMVIGLAFIESGVVLALVIALLMLFGGGQTKIIWATSIAEIGIALAIGVAATSISIASSLAVKSSCQSISRQPFFSQKILTLMLLCQSIIEAPVVFAFIISLVVRAGLNESLTIFEGIKYFAACFCMALGCIGPSTGQGIFAKATCEAVGLNEDAYGKIFTFSIINEAVIETPLIFSLLMSILIAWWPISVTNPLSNVIAFLIAALTMGLGSFGAGSAIGIVASKGCKQIALNTFCYPSVFRSTLLSQAFIESCAIYTLIIALFLVTRSW